MKLENEMPQLRVEYLQKILQNRKPTAINQFEVELTQKRKTLVEIDNYLKQTIQEDLTFFAKKIQKSVKPSDTVTFLIDVFENTNNDGKTIALDMLTEAHNDNLKFKMKDLIHVFNECAIDNNSPILFVSIIGEDIEEEQEIKPQSGLNLEAMKNFK